MGLPSKTFILGITVLAVVIIIGGASWTILDLGKPTTPADTNNTLPDQTPSEQPEPQNPEDTVPAPENSTDVPADSQGVTEEQVKDAAMAHIKSTYPVTAQFMINLTWNGGRLETESLETETYVFYASYWTVTVEWPMVSNPTYKVSAAYSLEETLVMWEGSYQNGKITETKYSYTQ